MGSGACLNRVAPGFWSPPEWGNPHRYTQTWERSMKTEVPQLSTFSLYILGNFLFIFKQTLLGEFEQMQKNKSSLWNCILAHVYYHTCAHMHVV